MTVVVTAIFRPLEGRKSDLIAAMRAGIEAVHQEQGCELYAIHDAEDGTVTMLEKWTTVEDLDAHGAGSAVGILNRDVEEFLASPVEVTRMTPILMGAPEQGAL